MRKRAPRVVTALAILGAGLVVCLVALEKEALAEQIAIWRVRLAGHTVVVPRPGSPRKADLNLAARTVLVRNLLSALADVSGRPIVVKAAERGRLDEEITLPADIEYLDAPILAYILGMNGIGIEQEAASGLYHVRRNGRGSEWDGLIWVGE